MNQRKREKTKEILDRPERMEKDKLEKSGGGYFLTRLPHSCFKKLN